MSTLVKRCITMIKVLTKFGNELNAEVYPGGTINSTPMESDQISVTHATENAKRLIAKIDELFKHLS